MKLTSNITSVESRIKVPTLTLNNFYSNPVEKTGLVKNKTSNTFSEYFEEIDWSSASAQVEGSVEINYLKEDNASDCISLPINTSFLFTCTKGRDDYYEMSWVLSMS